MYWHQGCANTGTISIQRAGQSANRYCKNNSSTAFSCICTSANTGPTCIRAKNNSSRIVSCMYRFCAGGYLSHETIARLSGGGRWGTSKQHMKLQQPRNYYFQVSQFDPPRSQSGNDREMTTKVATTVKRRLLHLAIIEAQMITLTTTAKLQQLRVNSREMTTFAAYPATTAKCNDREVTSQKLNNRRLSCTRFCIVFWLLSVQVPLGHLWVSICVEITVSLRPADFVSLHGCCRFKCLLEVSEKGTFGA